MARNNNNFSSYRASHHLGRLSSLQGLMGTSGGGIDLDRDPSFIEGDYSPGDESPWQNFTLQGSYGGRRNPRFDIRSLQQLLAMRVPQTPVTSGAAPQAPLLPSQDHYLDPRRDTQRGPGPNPVDYIGMAAPIISSGRQRSSLRNILNPGMGV